MSKYEKQWALVTGASSGLGKEFGRALAARKMNVVLAARREAPHERACQRSYGSGTALRLSWSRWTWLPRTSATALQERLEGRGIVPDVLINNAAFGLSGAFLTQDPTRLREMLQVDITSVVELTQVFGKQMAERGRGNILLVGPAWQPTRRHPCWRHMERQSSSYLRLGWRCMWRWRRRLE